MKEIELIHSAKNGDVDSFSKLLLLHQGALSCYLLTACKNKHDAEDILQDTFISAYKYLASYNVTWKFKTWLFTIAKRLLYKHYKQKHNKEEPRFEQQTYIDEGGSHETNIWPIIKKHVSKQSFDVLWFFYSEEFSIKEIAQILHCSQSWVKMSLFRSKKKLGKNTEIQNLFLDLITVGQ